MGITLSPVINRKKFSASQMNAWSSALLQMYAVAVAPRFPFFYTAQEKGYGDWNGYIYHVSDTFRWKITLGQAGRVQVDINGTNIIDTNTDGVSGTKNISALGLSLGSIYTLNASVIEGTAKIVWLGEVIEVNYTAPPTFTNGNVLSATNLDDLRSRILDLDILAACPSSPCERFLVKDSLYGKSSDRAGELYVARGTFCWMGQDILGYNFDHGATSAGQVVTTIRLDGDTVIAPGETTGGITHAGTVDISSIVSGFTLGEFYEFSVRTKIEGTDKKVKTWCRNNYIYLSSSFAPAAPNIWAHGDTDIDQTNLGWYTNLVNSLFPGSGAEDCALYYEYPAVRKNEDAPGDTVENLRYRIQHRHKYLKLYATDDSTKTATLSYNGTNVSLGEEGTLITYDLDQIPGLGYGEYYDVSYVDMAMETPTGE